MDIKKPFEMLDGMLKMVYDEELVKLVAEAKLRLTESWGELTADQQDAVYTVICANYLTLTAKVLALTQKGADDGNRTV